MSLPLQHDEPAEIELSIVIPVHDEEGNVGELARRLSAACAGLSHEIVFVDDASIDRTWSRCRDLSEQILSIRVVALATNVGQQAALQAGLGEASGRYVVLMDGDLEHAPELVPEMLRAAKAADVDVIRMIRRPPARRRLGAYLSAGFYRIFNGLSHTAIVPDAPDFCLLTRRVVDALNSLRDVRPFYRAAIPALGFRSLSIEFDPPARFRGEPSYSLRKRVSLAWTALFHHTTVALDVMTVVGAGVAIAAFAYAMASVFVRLVHEERVAPGWADVICSVLLLGGVNIVFLSVLGRYLAVLIEYAKARPTYLVDEQRSVRLLRAPSGVGRDG